MSPDFFDTHMHTVVGLTKETHWATPTTCISYPTLLQNTPLRCLHLWCSLFHMTSGSLWRSGNLPHPLEGFLTVCYTNSLSVSYDTVVGDLTPPPPVFFLLLYMCHCFYQLKHSFEAIVELYTTARHFTCTRMWHNVNSLLCHTLVWTKHLAVAETHADLVVYPIDRALPLFQLNFSWNDRRQLSLCSSFVAIIEDSVVGDLIIKRWFDFLN